MAKDNRGMVKLECSDCGRINYTTTKKLKPEPGKQLEKLKLSKYCKWCKKKVEHKETK